MVTPSDECLSCVGLSGLVEVAVGLGPERPREDELIPVGTLLAEWSSSGRVLGHAHGPGLEVRAEASGSTEPSLSWIRPELRGSGAGVLDQALELGAVVALSEARRGEAGTTLGYLAPWRGPEGVEAISAQQLQIRDGVLEATLGFRDAEQVDPPRSAPSPARARDGRDLAVIYSEDLLFWLGRPSTLGESPKTSQLLDLRATANGLVLRAKTSQSDPCQWRIFESAAEVGVHQGNRPRIIKAPRRARLLEASGAPQSSAVQDEGLQATRKIVDTLDRLMAQPLLLGPDEQRPQPMAARSTASGVVVESLLAPVRGGTRVRPRTQDSPTIPRVRPRSDPRRPPPAQAQPGPRP